MSGSQPTDILNNSETLLQSQPNLTEQTATGDHNQVIDQLTGGAAIASVEGTVNFYQQTDPETIKRIVQEELHSTQRDYGHSVKVGLNALVELMQEPEIHAAVITFRVDFQATCEQIAIIANNKEMHDRLHTLELNCYNQIVQYSRDFPADETALSILADHEMQLREIIADIQDIAARGTHTTPEISWIPDLKQAQSELNAAITELDLRRLQRAIWLMNRVLAIQPSRINTQLNAAARTLRITSLLKAMQAIWAKIPNATISQEKFQQLQQGMTDLAQLEQRLAALIITHDYWQELDLLLRRIEANLDKDLLELEMSWPDLKDKTEFLFNSAEDQWADDFQKDSQNLEAALETKNPAKIKHCFRGYRRKASNRFFKVDATLRGLCDELREVGEPLASILRMME